ncbi:hypothetical protein [Bacillus sp. XF8]|uniref:hypothetical protein n=1 Tax=Bacillus sp. XF8 TaxID=2819289 RepID=UPI001AA07011|nr:hypothetical protein [Bacillus sp. XF8]
MERYKEISTADLFEMIAKGNFKNIYWKNNNDEIVPAGNYNFRLDRLAKVKWFKREVIE